MNHIDMEKPFTLLRVFLAFFISLVTLTATHAQVTIQGGDEYSTIQAAINAASSGAIIDVSAGTYNESLTIDKPLTLKGAQTGVDPRPSVGSLRNTDGTGESIIEGLGTVQLVNITASNVLFDGFLLRHTTTAPNEAASRDLLGSPDGALKQNVTVSNNIFLNATDEGVQLRNTNHAKVEKNYVLNSVGDGVNICLNLNGVGHQILDNEIEGSKSDWGSIYIYTISNVLIKGNLVKNGKNGIFLGRSNPNYGTGYKVENITVENNEVQGNAGTQTALWVQNDGTNNIDVKNNKFILPNTYTPIWLKNRGMTGVKINNNHIQTNGSTYINANEITAEIDLRCNWYGSTNPTTVASYFTGSTPKLTYPFLTTGTDTDGSLIGFTPEVNACTGKVHNVTKNQYYLTIQAAINAANISSMDSIYVTPGIYEELVTIDKGVILAGANYNKLGKDITRTTESIIRFPSGLTGAETKNIITVTASNVTINGFKISDEGHETASSGVTFRGIYTLGGNNVVIKNNIVDGDGFNRSGIQLSGGANNTANPGVSGGIIDGNYIKDISNYSSIYVQHAGAVVRNNKVENGPRGIQIQPYHNVNTGAVYDNEFNAFVSGIYYNYAKKGAGKWEIYNNTVSAAQPSEAETQSWALDKSWHGIAIQSFGTEGSGAIPEVNIYDNIVDGSITPRSTTFWSEFRGIDIITSRGKANIYDNQVKNVDVALVVQSTSDVSEIVVNKNTFTDFVLGAKNLSTNLLDATCNWWGTDNAEIVKTNVTGNLNFLPFSTVGTPSILNCDGHGPVKVSSGDPLVVKSSHFEIQAAIDATTTVNGDVIEVAAGTYPEVLILSKSLDIRGPNYNTSPNTGTRVSEAILVPATSGSSIITAQASNISINGFTIDGDNTDITTGWLGTNSADIDAYVGIDYYDPTNTLVLNGLKVENNILQNLQYFAIELYGWGSQNTTANHGHLIKNNLFKDLGTYSSGNGYDKWGGGVILANNCYASITDNVMSNVRIGVQTGNFSRANTGGLLYQSISGNTIQARRVGLFHNLHYSSASPFTLSENTITALENSNEVGVNGIVLSSLSVNSNTSENTINLTGVGLPTSGIQVWNVKSTSPATISGGFISNVDNGIFVNNFEGYNSNAADGAHATISDVSISPKATGTGIKVLDSPSSTSHASVQVTLGDGIEISGGATGILVENANAKVNSPIGNVSFTAQTANYIELKVNTNNIDASAAIFDTVPTTAMTTSQLAAVENKIIDKDDNATLGQVLVKNGVRNETKELANVGTFFRYATIQAAINAADDNDLIIADAGLYNEEITINKPLTLKGAQAGVDPRPSVGSSRTINGLDETVITAALNKNVISIIADNVILDGLQITQSGGSGTADAIKASNSQIGITILNNIIHAVTDEGIQLEAGKDYLIEKNYVLNPKGDGITLSSYNLSPLKGENQKIINNEIKGSESAAGSIYLYGIKEVEISKNLISTKSSGIALGTLTEPTHDINVHYNTILTELRTAYSGAANGIGMDGTGSNIAIKNNYIEQVGDFIPAPANKDRSNLIRIGISSASDPTNVVIEENFFSRSGNQNYVYINSSVSNIIELSCNWYDGATTFKTVLDLIEDKTTTGFKHNVTFLKNGTNTVGSGQGFEPAANSCYTPVYNDTKSRYFSSIQSAISSNYTENGDVIEVVAGTYEEDLTVSKSLDIRGPNFGISPNTGTRLAEAILVPATNTDIAKVTASNVSIAGFAFDGDNTALTSSVIGTNGADIDARTAISIASPGINSLKVENNTFKNLGYFGVELYGSNTSEANSSKTGHLIKNNKFNDLGYYKVGAPYHRWGGGVLLYNSHYSRIEGNVMENVRVGIQTGNFQTTHTGDSQYQEITNNHIQTRSTGIFYNLHRYSPYTISNNTITALYNVDEQATATRAWNGLLVGSLGNNMGETILENNSVDGSGMTADWSHSTNGINVWNVTNNAPAKVLGGLIENVDNGIFVNNFEGYTSNAADGAHASVSGTIIRPKATGTGIKVLDSPSSTHTPVEVTLGDGIEISGGTTGILVENANAKVNSPIGNVSFTGQTANYIVLKVNANNIDASAAIFDTKATTAMTTAEVEAVEDKIIDKDDNATLGQVLVKYGVRNETKELANAGTFFRYATIQAAIDAADNNDVIIADAGVYNEEITVNKPLTLKGAQAGVDPRTAAALRMVDGSSETIVTSPRTTVLVNITSSNVVIDGFQFTHTALAGSPKDMITSPATPLKSNLLLANNILVNAADEAIQMRGFEKAIVEKNYVLNAIGDAINLCDHPTATETSYIQDNQLVGSKSEHGAIFLYTIKNVEILRNKIESSNNGIRLARTEASSKVENVIIKENDITGEFDDATTSTAGIRVQGPGTTNVQVLNNKIVAGASPRNKFSCIQVYNNVTNISIHENYMESGKVLLMRFAYDGDDLGGPTQEVNASCNWFGSTDYTTISTRITGNGARKTYPFLSDGTDSDLDGIGFTPLTGKCTGNVHNKTQNDYYLTIQEAVTLANAGDTLLVASGTYDEQVLVNKKVTIKSDETTKPIIKFTGTPVGQRTLFDVSADSVVIEGLRFEVDFAEIGSAVIASGAAVNTLTFNSNEIEAKGTPGVNVPYGIRNAVRVLGAGGVNVIFNDNEVSGTLLSGSFFRAGLAVDEGAVSAERNKLQTVNHDISVRFNTSGTITLVDNVFNGGGVELAEQNGGSGKVTVKDNKFNGAGAPNYALLRVKNNQSGVEHEIFDNTFTDYKWAISLENMKNVTVESNTFTTTDPTANALVINTKSMSSNSSEIVQTTIDATVIDNNFEGAGRGIVFLNHDNRAGTSFGTFTIGQTGKENKFGADLSSFIALDSQVGSSLGSTFPTYGGTSGTWLTTMACWSQNINAENNTFDVGSGLKLPATLNATERGTLETKLTHKVDNSCLGTIQFFNPVHNLTQNTFFSKIQDAVNAADVSDIIELSEWTFTEAVNINKPLTIQGVDSAKVILDGATVANGNGFTLAANVKNITIKNLTVKNFKGSEAVGSAIYGTRNSKLTIDKIIADNNQGRGGVFLSGPIDSVSITNSISKNHSVSGSRGIVIWDGLKSNIHIANNLIMNNNCCGIELQDGAATGVLIKGNTIYGLDNAIGVVGLTTGSGNNKANIIDSNFVYVKQRFGIEIKNPNGTGNDNAEEDGAIIVSRNTVTHQGASTLSDVRDLAGIAVHRRAVTSLNVDIPSGVVVKANVISDFKQASTSTGFGIVIEGTNHTVINNTLTGNDVGIQQQSGHKPYPADGNQDNVDDLYFGRGNSPIICNIVQPDNNTFTENGVNERIVVDGAIVTEITPTVSVIDSKAVCNGTTIAAIEFSGNNIPGTVYSWTNSEPSIGLGASGTGNIASFTATNTGTEPIEAKITVTPSLENGCTGEPIEFTITVNPTPSKPVINPGESTICEGGSVRLDAPCSVGSILWSTGATTTNIVVSPTTTTTYTAICKDPLGCEGLESDVATVIVLPRPAQPILTASATTICNGNEVTLTATGCAEGSTLIWPAGVTATGNVATVKPTTTQTYTVTCQQTLLSCQSLPSEVVTITVNSASFTAPTTSGNVLISSGASTNLTATCASGTPKWYDVAGEPLLLGSSSTSTYTTPALTANTDYSVRCVSNVNNENDCKGPAVVLHVTIDKFEIVKQPSHIYVCLGQNAFIRVGVTGRSVTYQWQKHNGTTWENLSNTGVYSGVNTYNLNIAAPGTALNDSKYRCVVTNTAPDATAPTILNTTDAFLSVYESALAHNLTMTSNISGTTNIYQAVQTIKGTNKISGASNIKYFAGNSITLEPGFEVSAGSVFLAKVQIPCTNTSSAEVIPEHIEK